MFQNPLSKDLFGFIKKMILIGLILFLVDQGVGGILSYYYFQQKSGSLYRTTYAMDITKAEILAFGSSRANHHYVPEVIEDSMKMSFYNTGRDGNFFLFNYAVFNSIIERYNPRVVILDINTRDFATDNMSYERLSSLLPYYKSHHVIRSIVNLRSPFEKIKLISATYPFNSLLLTIAISNFDFNKRRKADNKGYVAAYGQITNSKLEMDYVNINNFDQVKLGYLKKIIYDCMLKNIRLILVQSPRYKEKTESKSIDLFTKISVKENVEYYDFSNYDLFMQTPKFFKDANHLNHSGALKFSTLLVSRINSRSRNKMVVLEH